VTDAASPEDLDRLMAEVHAARLLAGRAVAGREGAAPRPSAAQLWAFVRRPAAAPVPLEVARALRDDPGAARRYRAMLAGLSLAHSPVALAASDGAVRRRLGEAVLELLPVGAGEVPLLVLTGGPAEAARALEFIGPNAEPLRLALPPADGGAVVLALGPDVPEAADALRLLREPATAIFLLP
jgi:hypothetical protein